MPAVPQSNGCLSSSWNYSNQSDEDQRAAREDMTEEELAIFDPAYEARTKAHQDAGGRSQTDRTDTVGQIEARETRSRLAFERTRQGRCPTTIRVELDALPTDLRPADMEEKVERTFQFVYERYPVEIGA